MIDKNHPEYSCQKCNGRNTVWYAPNDIWNDVMNDEPYGIVCPTCFLELSEVKGYNLIFTIKNNNNNNE